ncbi:MAG: peptidoglycan editing factor PgeF [Pseudomonadota bacterium]
MSLKFIKPDWPLLDKLNVVTTTRSGGVSLAPYDQLNLSMYVGDNKKDVEDNRNLVAQHLKLPTNPIWLKQIHSSYVVDAYLTASDEVEADASVTVNPETVCAVLTADCLPVVFSDENARCIGVAHAGWKGLLGGVLQQTIQSMAKTIKPEYAWLGPAIGPSAFEVGKDVYEAFINQNEIFKNSFRIKNNNKWYFNIYEAAKLVLHSQGITKVYGGSYCTHSEKDLFYSYRRDETTGRMATLVWKCQK